MNKIKKSIFTYIALVVAPLVALAQDPDPGDFGGDPNPVDAPIDSYVWVLIVVGLSYVFYKYRSLVSKVNKTS
jgi:hypothetical protein